MPFSRMSRTAMSRVTMLRLATGDPQSHRSRPIRPSRRARNERCCMHPLEWPRSRRDRRAADVAPARRRRQRPRLHRDERCAAHHRRRRSCRDGAGDEDRIHRNRRGGHGGRNARRVAPLRERDARAYRSGGTARAACAGERSTGAPLAPRRGSPAPHKCPEDHGPEHLGGAERRLDRAFGNGAAARVRHRSDWNGG